MVIQSEFFSGAPRYGQGHPHGVTRVYHEEYYGNDHGGYRYPQAKPQHHYYSYHGEPCGRPTGGYAQQHVWYEGNNYNQKRGWNNETDQNYSNPPNGQSNFNDEGGQLQQQKPTSPEGGKAHLDLSKYESSAEKDHHEQQMIKTETVASGNKSEIKKTESNVGFDKEVHELQSKKNKPPVDGNKLEISKSESNISHGGQDNHHHIPQRSNSYGGGHKVSEISKYEGAMNGYGQKPAASSPMGGYNVGFSKYETGGSWENIYERRPNYPTRGSNTAAAPYNWIEKDLGDDF